MTIYTYTTPGDITGTPGITQLTGDPNTLVVGGDNRVDFAISSPTAVFTYDSGATSHTFTVTLYSTGGGDYFVCCAGIVDATNFYCTRRNSAGNLQLYKYVAGSFTQLGSDVSVGSGSIGDTIYLTVNRITGEVIAGLNGSPLITVTDTAHTTGTKAGFFARGSTGTDVFTQAELVAIAAQTITDINGGDPLVFDTTGNEADITGFAEVPDFVSVGGIEQTITAATTGLVTFDLDYFVDGELRDDPTIDQEVIVSNSEPESATIEWPTNLPADWDFSTVASAVTDNPKYIFYTSYGLDSTNGNKVIFDTEGTSVVEGDTVPNFYIGADGGVSVVPAYVGTKVFWLWIASTGEMVEVTMTVTAEGVDTNSIVARHIVASSPVARSIVARGI